MVNAMNELLDDLKPINATTEKRQLVMLDLFKSYFKNFDMEDLNNRSLNHFDDYAEYFFSNFPYNVTERHMHVLGTLLAWLGSNRGRCFILEAKQLAQTLNSDRKGFIYAWADVNQRLVGVDNGNTLLELLLTPIEHHHHDRGLLCPANHYVTSHDIETANFFVHWLATTHGQGFINSAYQMVTQVIEETKAEFQKKYSA